MRSSVVCSGFVVLAVAWLGCGQIKPGDVPEDAPPGSIPPSGGDEVTLRPQPISWPLTGGLDTDTGPLSVVPGSHLTLDNVIQERRDEWRARNGTTVDAQDALPNGIAPLIGKLGDAGMFALNDKLATYQPSLASNRWTTAPGITIADDISRVPVMSTDNPIIGFAQAGNLYIVASLDSISPAIGVFDTQGKTHAKISLPTATYIRARCAATAGKLVAYLASSAGNLVTYVVDVSSGAVTGPTTIKTGLHTTAPHLDARWDGSSATITVVVRLAAADAVRFMEHNPSTGALATDVSLAAIVGNSCVALFQDYSVSGTRFVGVSDSTAGGTTRVLRVNTAGTILQNDLMTATLGSYALQMTGVGYNSGTLWDMLTLNAGLGVDRYYRDGGGLHPAAQQIVSTGSPATVGSIDGEAWSHDGTSYQVIIGWHSVVTSDPQDSWENVAIALGGGATAYEQSRITPLQASVNPGAVANASLFQRPAVSAHVSKFALPVLASYVLSAGVAKRQYSIDVFTQQVEGSADIATTVNHGAPIQYKQTTFVPANSASFLDEGILLPIGAPTPPPAITQGGITTGGSLTTGATYGYIQVIENVDSDGNIWRSPPSVPVTYQLTGGNTAVALNVTAWTFWRSGQRRRSKIYRTDANGSVYRLLNTQDLATSQSNYLFTDTLADTAIDGSEILYTTGELATAITPRFSHMATFGDRLWGINADFRTELWPSKNLRPGRQPEFVEEGVIDIDDNYGDLTGIVGLDGNGVAFKRTAIYFITGDGLTDAGSGQAHTYQQVATGIGAIPGSPLVVAGDRVFFVSDRGIYAIDRGANITYIGAGVDKYFNQPQIQTAERVYDGVFMPKQNEVRFVTTNYILVYDLKYETWTRWTGLSGMRRCLLINDRMVLFKTDGTVWREGDESVTTDNGTPYNGIIRSAWVRPTDFGQIRLYRGLALGERTAGGGNVTPTMQIYEDNSNTAVQSFSPPSPIGGSQSVIQAEARPQQQNCSAFSLQVTLPPSDVTTRLAKWGAEIGVRGGRAQKRVAGESWR